MQIDLRVVPQVSFGAAMHYFTGSKAHNIACRRIAVEKNWKLNEYGLFEGRTRLAGRSEEAIYRRLGLAYVAPELREDRGEIAAARDDRLPDLVDLDDIRGDLHMHTAATDGQSTIREMAEAAKARGYDYIAVNDHTTHVAVADGLDEKRLGRQIEEIDRLNEEIGGLRILKSAEVDILVDGRLDLPDSVLAKLDLTTCSVHYKFDLPEDEQTERLIRAMDNPYFTILGHPTGRLIQDRPAYAVDMERLLAAAKERGCFMEIDSQPERLDLSDIHAKMAKDMGVKLAISSDAHTTAALDYMRFGVGQARRGWLTAGDVINTRHWRDLKTLLKRG